MNTHTHRCQFGLVPEGQGRLASELFTVALTAAPEIEALPTRASAIQINDKLKQLLTRPHTHTHTHTHTHLRRVTCSFTRQLSVHSTYLNISRGIV